MVVDGERSESGHMIATASSPASRFFTSGGLELHVADHGGHGLPVIFVHGGSAHARWWDFVVPHLGPGFHAYALDLRGHGDSAWAPDGAYSIADHAGDV
ncbi:MAG: alpha/beta fold hydrolase, partial [Candidatus Binatia bacterium]